MGGGVDGEDAVMGVEAARARWSELIASAASGTVTRLRDAESGAVARLMPREQSPVPVEELPARAVTAARPKLGDLVRQAAAGRPVALTRRGDLAAVLAPVPGVSNPATDSGLDELLDTLTAPASQAPASLVPTGLGSLDAVLGGGLRPGQLALVTGLPGSGTSALALGAARASALAGAPGSVMVASAQMSRQDLAARMLAAEAGLPLAQITAQTVPEADRPRLEAAAARLRGAPLHLVDRQTSLTQARTAAAAVPGLALLVLDPVTHFDVGTAAPVLALRRLATDLRAAVLAVATHGPGLLPVEAEADLAARLHRQADGVTAQLEIIRYRHGPAATLPLTADLARARLLPAAPGPVGDEPPTAPPPHTPAELAAQPSADSPRPPTTPAQRAESSAARAARAGHQRHQAARRTKSADQAAQALREMITGAVEDELDKAQGDAEAAMDRLSKRAIPDVMRLFEQTRAGARYEYTAFPALPDILHRPSKQEPDLVWEARPSWRHPDYRRHPDGELAVTPLDVNAAYLSALKCHLPIGRLEHNPTGDYDPKRAGVHLITPPAWHHPDLPNPLGDREEPGPLWITTATLRLLLRLAGPKHQLLDAPVIHESWTSSATENFLDALRQVLAGVRTDALDQDDYVTLHYIKMMYSKLVSTMGESTDNREIMRPDWMHNIRSQAFANLYGRALKAHQAGLTVISVLGTDELHLTGDVWAARWQGKPLFAEGRGLADMKVKTDRDGAAVHYSVTRTGR